MLSKLVVGAIAGLVFAIVGSVIALPLFVWGTKDAPAFYGAFAAAIVAAVAVVLGSFYQFWLGNRRDRRLQEHVEISGAIELSFWLRHAAEEMQFICSVLQRLCDSADSQVADSPPMSLSQFREIVTAHFFGELQVRAQDAAKLPHEIAKKTSRVIYSTFTVADRILALRGATESFRPDREQLETYVSLTKKRAEDLRDAAQEIEVWLSRRGVIFD